MAVVAWRTTSSSSGHVSSGLVYTKWTADANALSGPEVGYKPSLTGLSADDVAKVTVAADSFVTGNWDINLTFTPRGKSLFASLTRDNVAACPGDVGSDTKAMCVERYLTMWLGLTQADIDRWDEISYATKVSQPFGSGGKLLANAITLEEIDGGSVQIGGSFTQKEAQELGAAIKPTSTTSSTVRPSVAGWLGGLALLMFIAAVALVIRRLIRPQRKVIDAQPPASLPPGST